MTPLPWVDGSQVCGQTDPEIWFPDRSGSTAAAKALCGTCPLVAPCREYVLAEDTKPGLPLAGVWGGLSIGDRERIRGHRRPGRPRTRWGDPPPAPVKPVPGQLPLPTLQRSA